MTRELLVLHGPENRLLLHVGRRSRPAGPASATCSARRTGYCYMYAGIRFCGARHEDAMFPARRLRQCYMFRPETGYCYM